MPEEKSPSRRGSVCEIKKQPFDLVVVRSADERTLEDILRLEKQCYPDAWQYPDAKEYYGEILKQEESLHIFLREGDVSVGYLLGRPLSEVCGELREYDRDLQDDSACFYLETIGIDPKCAGRRGGAQLLEAFRQEVKNRKSGYERISAHARKAVGSDLSGLIQKMYANASVRHIPKWHFGGDEPYDYVVWSIE
ncbi:MAG: GNAT family N-acetyltransferase [Candidatus Moraniibacteriota bacterium]